MSFRHAVYKTETRLKSTVRIELTFYHNMLKRTHNLGLEGGLNFRWQYTRMATVPQLFHDDAPFWLKRVSLIIKED